MTAHRALLAAVSTALLLGLAWGCSAAGRSNDSSPNSGGANGISEAGNDAQTLTHDGSSLTDGGDLVLNPLCGKAPSCVPDQGQGALCDDYMPPIVASDDAGPEDAALDASLDAAMPSTDADVDASATSEGGAGGEPGFSAGAGGAAGASGASALPNASGGASGASGQAGASAEGGAAGGMPLPPPKFACQVQRLPNALNTVVSQCGVAGPGLVGDPCLTASDCAAGYRANNRTYGALGCVGDGNSGVCEPYCCKDVDSCEKGTYCAERPLRDAVTNARAKGTLAPGRTLLIPVCVPAENCDLSAPYPCPAGMQCACKSGTACLVVRSDGTTTCAVPGTGQVGDACPCAWGHVCSAATNQCLKLCYTRGAASCGDGKCQSASELPDGWGVCVGATPSTD